MDKHLQALVGSQVKVGVAIHTTGIASVKIFNRKLHGLLVELCDLGLTAINDTGHTGRQHIVHRLTRGILLDVDSIDTDSTVSRLITAQVEVVLVVTPLAAHQLNRSKSQVSGGTESRHEHTHETYRREVLDIAHLTLVINQRDGELVPSGMLYITIGKFDIRLLLVGDIVHADAQRVGMNGYPVLEIALILVQGVVLIDILDIGRGTRGLVLSILDIAL